MVWLEIKVKGKYDKKRSHEGRRYTNSMHRDAVSMSSFAIKKIIEWGGNYAGQHHLYNIPMR